ncbi:hypothetical protein [Microcystis sp. Msp_OC_L_20101000_S702]|nr:hypothetical protein [Microcystis sp. Msp_OC_L_20101000_S702]
MTQRYVDSPWYGKIWAFLKQFPQGLAEGANLPLLAQQRRRLLVLVLAVF